MKSKKILSLFVFLAIISISNAFPTKALSNESSTIEVPKGKSITIDGKINEDEWKDAFSQELENGGNIKINHDGEFLQIGLQGGKAGLSHVYLTDGKDIFVLHASAALGMAIYQKSGETWQPTQKFKWELRDQASNTEGSSAYLKTNGWLASVSNMSATDREYKISMKFKEGEKFRMVAVYYNNPTTPQFFPHTISDDTLKAQLLFGSEPPNLSFKFEQWATLKLKDSEILPKSVATKELDEAKTPYSIGFKSFLWADNSRLIKFKNQTNSVARPIRAFVWYPTAKSTNAKFIKFADYVYATNLTKESSQLTLAEKDELQKKLVSTLEFFAVTTEQVDSLMKAETKAIADAPETNEKFPLLILGNVGEGFYYSSTAEFLAANGYVVVSLPSLGVNDGERCGFDLNCLKLQQTDMEFAIEKMCSFQNVDASKIGLIAWSFSGLAVAHLPLKNQSVKAVVSLDAATGYQYGKEILDQSKELEIGKKTVPFLHFHGLGGTSRVPKNFEFFNSYQSKEKHLVAMKSLQHSDFISLYGIGVMYAKKENNEKALAEIRLVNSMTLEFLNANLKNNRQSLKKFNEMKRGL